MRLKEKLSMIFGSLLIICIITATKPVASEEDEIVPDSAAEPTDCEVVRTVTDKTDTQESVERTVRCTCPSGKSTGTHREKPACIADQIFETKEWCNMEPCLEQETCAVMEDLSGWTCTFGDRTKNVIIKQEDKEEIQNGEDKTKNDEEQNQDDLE